MTDHDEFRDVVRRGYDGLAGDYDAQREGGDPPALLANALADVRAETDGRPRLLDVGCGGGRGVLAPLGDGFDGVGVDFSREQLRLAGDAAPAADRVQADMTTLPVRENACDALTALHSVIHVPSDQHAGVYREFRRVLRDGGVAVVTAGTGAWQGANDDWLDSGERMQWSFPDADATERALRNAGFAVVDSQDVGDELGEGRWRFYRVE